MTWLGWVVAVVLAVVAVQLYRRLRELSRERLEMLAALEREQQAAAEVPVLQERARIARELHEVATQDLGAIALQAAGGHDDADRALRAIRREAEEAAEELRRSLGVLGAAPEPVSHAGIAQLPELVERARTAGIPATLNVDGRPRPIPPSLDRGVYRIVQEALANVRAHARASRVAVRLEEVDGGVLARVSDDGAGFLPGLVERRPAGHLGLISMREQATMAGGWSRIASAPGMGTTVEAWLPRPES
jgi:signal transduction histidine kinase